MKNFIPLARPNILESDIALVSDVLRSGMLVQGKYVLALEEAFIKTTGAEYASALSNGTATLHLALIALGIGPGDEVIVPAFSYVATANVVELVGAKPVFVDIEPLTYNIDCSLVEKEITTRTKAIIPVHEFGLACNIGQIMELARRHNIAVIEDAACALGADYKGRHVGSFGDFGSFSLHPRKAISSGEGGVLITNQKDRDYKIKVLRNHGADTVNDKADFTAFGFNYRMTDFQAALVYSQMSRLRQSIDYKRELAAIYYKEIKSGRCAMPHVPEYTEHTWQTFHVVVNDDVDRDALIGQLKEKGIGTNYGAQCIPYMSAYSGKYNLNCKALFPNALKAYQKGLALPIHDLVTHEQVYYISKTINSLL